MNVEQWPLTAAATSVLLELPAPGAKRGKGSPDVGEVVKLALKELLLRGAYRIEVEERRLRGTQVSLIPIERPNLPRSLAEFDSCIRPYTPDEIGNVIKTSRKANSAMFEQAGKLFLEELAERDLASSRTDRLLFGLVKAERWRRTASGEAWAADARTHLDDLEALPVLDPDDVSRADDAGRTLATAGALAVMVPGGIAQLAMLDQLRRRGGESIPFVFMPTDGGTAFDPVESAGGLIDSAIGDALSGVDSVTDAIDTMSSSIDSGVNSGVDSGGGSDVGGGGDGGGGGGDGG